MEEGYVSVILLIFVFQLRVVAYDTGVSRLRATAECFITVRRNLNGPVFNPATYEVTIQEDLAVNTYIQKLNVSDSDGVRIFFIKEEHSLVFLHGLNKL
jgi:hypothetical protein